MPSSSQRPIDDPAADAALLLIRLGLVVLAFGAPLSVVISRRAIFTLLPVGAGLLLLAATLLPKPRIKHRLRLGAASLVGLSLLGLMAWSALSMVWTPFPIDATERWGKDVATLLVVAAAVTLLPERTRTSNLYLFPLGLAVTALATAVAAVLGPQAMGAFQDADPTLERAVLSIVTLVWPAIAALAIRERWVSAGLLVFGVIAAAMVAWTSTALIALALGALAFSIATINAAGTGTVLAWLLGGLILLAPALTLVVNPATARLADAFGDRLPVLGDIAQATTVWAHLVQIQPLRLITGHGLDMAVRAGTTGFLPAGAPRGLLFDTWYELGLVGAVATAALFGGALYAGGRASATLAPFLLAEIVTVFVIAVWGFDTTQLWWFTVLGVAVLAFANAIRGQYRTHRPAVRLAPSVGSENAATG